MLIKPGILFPLISKETSLDKALKMNCLQERMAPKCRKTQKCLNFFLIPLVTYSRGAGLGFY